MPRRGAKKRGTGGRGDRGTGRRRRPLVPRSRGPTVPPAAERIGPIIERLYARFPDARCALTHENPLQLLVATILSAQCTDARVNQVTKDLFRKYRTARAYADADPAVFEQQIRSTGFFRNKTKSILGMACALVDHHGGRVPDTMEELVPLTGVGRKTANVILGTAFEKNEGVVVDTHVARISRRLRLTKHEDPVKIEQDLMKLVPKTEWIDFSHRLIWHGRKICVALRPKCSICPVGKWCPTNGKFE